MIRCVWLEVADFTIGLEEIWSLRARVAAEGRETARKVKALAACDEAQSMETCAAVAVMLDMFRAPPVQQLPWASNAAALSPSCCKCVPVTA
eukprot:CAMPEP_0119338370 /NCGR_PEP_ID=MMETSP1333-20130426/95866_1 /TAXON_ID=418940 /ORGANISM="Scyphosphaera apsteinii, Strain RCC1455" /LENGTH=91 /DNA_ID=CAMNT_0007349615 /DNA_START=89 /DNA_END=365 /DNA_ORIENTATION=+